MSQTLLVFYAYTRLFLSYLLGQFRVQFTLMGCFLGMKMWPYLHLPFIEYPNWVPLLEFSWPKLFQDEQRHTNGRYSTCRMETWHILGITTDASRFHTSADFRLRSTRMSGFHVALDFYTSLYVLLTLDCKQSDLFLLRDSGAKRKRMRAPKLPAVWKRDTCAMSCQ